MRVTKWIRFRDTLGGCILKVMLIVVFFFVFTPVSFILKIMGRDFLNKNVDKSVKSYWIYRFNQPGNMENQF